MFGFDITLNSVVMAVSSARGPPGDRYKTPLNAGYSWGSEKKHLSICLALFYFLSFK
jgi:hypothetical protein